MSDDIRVARHNGDSGRMVENALRQRFDERTQLNEHHADDVLRDTEATSMQDVATQEQRQTNLVHFEEEPAYSSSYGEETDPFETIFASTGFEEPAAHESEQANRKDALKEPEKVIPGADAVAARTTQDNAGKAGVTEPDPVRTQTPNLPTNAGDNFVTNRHKVWEPSTDCPQPESGSQWTEPSAPQKDYFDTVYSGSPFGYESSPSAQTEQFFNPNGRVPEGELRSIQRNADSQTRSADASDPLAALAAQHLLDNAKKSDQSTAPLSDGDNLVTNRHKVQDGSRASRQGQETLSRSAQVEGRGTGTDLSDPLAMHTNQVLLNKAQRKSQIDRMLSDNPEHNIDPDSVLKPSGAEPVALLDGAVSAAQARTISASAGRFLKNQGQRLLRLGVRSSAAAVMDSQLFSQQEGADADAQKTLDAAKDGQRGVRTLRRGLRMIQKRQAAGRAAQASRATAKAADTAVKKAAEGGTKKLFGAIAEGTKEMIAALAALVGGALTPVLVVVISILLVVVLFMSIFTSMVGSPYGIFFVKEQQQELEFSTAINRITNSYFSQIYEREMSKDYESVEVNCEIADSSQTWRKIVAVYAVDVCKQGLDAITMDEEHYNILKDVFWDKISLSFSETSRTERVETVVREAHTETETHYYDPMGYEVPSPVTGGTSQTVTVNVPAEIEVSYVTYITLHVNVREKSLDELKAARNLDEGEKKTVDDLLAESDDLWATLEEDFTNLIITGDSGGSVGAIDVTAYATVGETVYRALIREGYTPQAACGILGNIQQECSMNPRCVTGGAYGLCQWMGGRKTNLMRLRGYATASVQTGFMISELRSDTGIWRTYGGQVHHTYAGVHINSLSQFKRCTSVRAAAGAFCICFERSNEFPGNQWYEARLNYASQWYRYAQSHWMGAQ